jgi:hypothetical protein
VSFGAMPWIGVPGVDSATSGAGADHVPPAGLVATLTMELGKEPASAHAAWALPARRSPPARRIHR